MGLIKTEPRKYRKQNGTVTLNDWYFHKAHHYLNKE